MNHINLHMQVHFKYQQHVPPMKLLRRSITNRFYQIKTQQEEAPIALMPLSISLAKLTPV